MSIYDLTCIKNDVCDKAVCDYKECKNRADTIEVMKHSVQQLKAEIARLKGVLELGHIDERIFIELVCDL